MSDLFCELKVLQLLSYIQVWKHERRKYWSERPSPFLMTFFLKVKHKRKTFFADIYLTSILNNNNTTEWKIWLTSECFLVYLLTYSFPLYFTGIINQIKMRMVRENENDELSYFEFIQTRHKFWRYLPEATETLAATKVFWDFNFIQLII